MIAAERAYIAELNNVARDGAMIDALVRNKLPGMPNVAALEAYSGSKKLLQALSGMVITQREGVLITDNGLAKLCGVETYRLNEYARDRGISIWSAIAYPIDFSGDIKFETAAPNNSAHDAETSQPVVYKDDIKPQSHGGRRKGVNYYGLSEAIAAAAAVSNLSGARTDGLDDILTRAFGIAIDEIDTNPYRREHRHLLKAIETAQSALATAEADCIALLFFDRTNPSIMRPAFRWY